MIPVKGQIHDDGVAFDAFAKGAIDTFNILINDQSKGNPFVVLDIGDKNSRSSKYTKWVISSTPSYSLMRPYWIGTLSATILNGYTQKVTGSLLPGFCPFFPDFTNENLLYVQSKINKGLKTNNALITFIQDEKMELPPDDPQYNTGIFQYPQFSNPFDKWFSLTQLDNGNIVLKNNDYTTKGQLIAAVFLSLVIAAVVSIVTTRITVIGINLMYNKLVEFANHLSSYAKLEQTKIERALEKTNTKKTKTKTVNPAAKNTFLNFMKNSPSPSAFIDYLSLILYKQFSSSVNQFYNLLFRQVKLVQIGDEELDPDRDRINGADAKVLYEKFCFINHLNEEKLTDKSNEAILKRYGFRIVTRDDLISEVFTNINVKNYDNYLTNVLNHDENADSLEIYMKENVKITQFYEDQVEVATFMNIYNRFCDYNRLPRVLISASLMKERFEVSSDTVPQQFIMRKVNYDDDFQQNYSQGIVQKLARWWENLSSKNKKTYIIDTTKLENHFKLVMDKIAELSEEELKDATVDLILYPRWWIWDAFTVILHMLVVALITIPLLALVILNESQYQPWSLKKPTDLIVLDDLFRDPALMVVNLYTGFGWNQALAIIVSILVGISLLDLLLYYTIMDFPQDKSFKKSEDQGETFLQKGARRLQWILVLIALSFYFGYIGVVLTWLLLGAFINPNAFLPFASAAVTFVTFVVTKYNAFKSLLRDGRKAVMDYLKVLFGDFFNKVMGKLTQDIEQVTGSVADKGKALLKSEGFKSATGKLADAGFVDPDTINEYVNKIQALDGKNIVEGAVAVANDPAMILKEIENMTRAMVTHYTYRLNV